MERPIFLLLLLLVPLIILLHEIRTKRKDVTVSSLMLWRRLLQESRRSFRIRQIVKSLALILQILAVVTLVLALTEPSLGKRLSQQADHLIFVIDTSASMKTRWKSGTRFDEARGMALQALQELADGTQVMVISVGARPALVNPFTDDRNRINRVIRQIRVSDEPGNMREALLLALSLTERESKAGIWLFSDGAFDLDLDLSQIRLRYFQVGGEARNAAITGFQFRRRIDQPQIYEIMVRLKNYSTVATDLSVELLVGDILVKSETIRMDPLRSRTLIFPYEGLITDRATVELAVEDDLAVDNRGFTVLTLSQKVKVLIVGPGNHFLERALSAYPNVLLSREDVFTAGQAHDIVIFDREAPPELGYGNYLLIDSLAPNLPWKVMRRLEAPRVTSWDASHPLLRSIDLSDLIIGSATQISSSGEGKGLVRSGNTPLMVCYERKNLRVVYLGFNLLESDFPLRVSFPVMVGNILSWLYAGALPSATRQVQTGEPFVFSVSGGVEQLAVISPDGRTDWIRDPENPTHYTGTSSVGFYRIVGSSGESSFAANLVDEEESDIRPRFLAPNTSTAGEADVVKVERPIWPALLITALLLLLAEWLSWVRKW
jgi:Ca-activated chloride channel family protein